MRKRIIFILTIIFSILTSCEDEPAYLEENWTIDQFQPETIEMTKATVNGKLLYISKYDLLESNGEPIKIVKNCFGEPPGVNRIVRADECWIYDSINYEHYYLSNDTIHCYLFNFYDSDFQIKTPQIILSNKTTEKEIKKIFPNSYSHRNLDVVWGLEEGDNWFYLKDDIHIVRKYEQNLIALLFNDGTLKRMEYYFSPTLSLEEWKEYNDDLFKRQFEEELRNAGNR